MLKQSFFVFFFGVLILFSCKSKNEQMGSDKSESDDWKEMDQFHMAMAEAFHPYKDSSNLEPVKTHVAELVSSAKIWVEAPIPEKVNQEEMKTKLHQLQSEALLLETAVKSGSDSLIGVSLTTLHTTFHQIQEQWYTHGNEEHEHQH